MTRAARARKSRPFICAMRAGRAPASLGANEGAAASIVRSALPQRRFISPIFFSSLFAFPLLLLLFFCLFYCRQEAGARDMGYFSISFSSACRWDFLLGLRSPRFFIRLIELLWSFRAPRLIVRQFRSTRQTAFIVVINFSIAAGRHFLFYRSIRRLSHQRNDLEAPLEALNPPQ